MLPLTTPTPTHFAGVAFLDGVASCILPRCFHFGFLYLGYFYILHTQFLLLFVVFFA